MENKELIALMLRRSGKDRATFNYISKKKKNQEIISNISFFWKPILVCSILMLIVEVLLLGICQYNWWYLLVCNIHMGVILGFGYFICWLFGKIDDLPWN